MAYGKLIQEKGVDTLKWYLTVYVDASFYGLSVLFELLMTSSTEK